MSAVILKRIDRISAALMLANPSQHFRCFYFRDIDRGGNQAEAERMAEAVSRGLPVLRIVYHAAPGAA